MLVIKVVRQNRFYRTGIITKKNKSYCSRKHRESGQNGR